MRLDKYLGSSLSEKMEVDQVVKTKDGKVAVKWKGKNKFQVIDDKEVGLYLMYLITRNPEEKKKISDKKIDESKIDILNGIEGNLKEANSTKMIKDQLIRQLASFKPDVEIRAKFRGKIYDLVSGIYKDSKGPILVLEKPS